jgi:hypothetical protein
MVAQIGTLPGVTCLALAVTKPEGELLSERCLRVLALIR